MTIAVGAGEERGVAGSGAGVGVVVVAVGEVRSVIEEETESAFAKLLAVTLQIVTAKLVDVYPPSTDFSAGLGGGEARRDGSKNKCSRDHQ